MSRDIKVRWEGLVQWHKAVGIGQTLLAEGAGVSQSAVSRILSQCPVRDGQAFRRLCVYASTHPPTGENPRQKTSIDHTELAEAIFEVWNGTPEHASAIAAVIRAVGVASKVLEKPYAVS